MRKWLLLTAAGALLFGAGLLVGQRTVTGEKTLIHAIAFKQVDGTTPEQLKEVWAATEKMAAEVPGIKRVWMGKVTNRGPAYTHGIVMEFENAEALKHYAPHPAHKKWEEIYFKVRTPGTNTIDVVGE
ncbi:MAG: Dabb family protein [Dongiaceae bacterium]